ncbi:MAG: hypothetical protein ACO3NZ_03345 [Pirellulales bacterium]|jgi:uncharacterized repeat protein (TIGR01451 family)
MSWLRIGSIAMTAVLLASCRSMPRQDQSSSAVVGSLGSGPVEFRPIEPTRVSSNSNRVGAAMPDGEIQQVSFSAACEPGVPCPPCEPQLMAVPMARLPRAGGCLICDGGDHLAPAKVRDGELVQLTAGDTVAKYRAEDDLEHETCIAVSNCTCVFAPRFASVREVVRPFEGSVIASTSRLESDRSLEIDTGLDPVVSGSRRIGPDTTRQNATGLGIETATVALGVEKELLPDAAIGEEHPQAASNEQDVQPVSRVLDVRDVVGFDVPFAWTCLQEASVMVGEKPAAVISSDRTTATLRIEEEGRAELTISKSAGNTTARAGEELDFTIAFFNSGNRPLADVVLVDALPQRLEYVADSADATVPASFSTGHGDDGSVVLTWRLNETLQPGETGFVRFRTLVR